MNKIQRGSRETLERRLSSDDATVTFADQQRKGGARLWQELAGATNVAYFCKFAQSKLGDFSPLQACSVFCCRGFD